jgi:hypothetical protein
MVNNNNNQNQNQNQQQQRLEYAEWQKTEDKYGNHYVVYQTGGLDDCYYVVELDEYLISKVIGPSKYDLDDPKQLTFGCYTCDGPDDAVSNTIQNRIPEICRHRQAVITVLKRRRDLNNNNNNIGGEGATEDGWVITFAESERGPQKERVKGDIIR